MSVQALWIVKTQSGGIDGRSNPVLFARFYQPYIKKSKQIDGEKYVPLLNNAEMAKALLFELGYTQDGFTKFVPSRDSCQQVEQKPVYELSTSQGKLWPLVVVEQQGLALCCLPFVPQGASKRPPLIDIPGVTLGFTLLCALGDFLRTTQLNEFDQKTGDIYAFLTQAAPFGTILDTSGDSILAKITNKPITVPKSQKQPAWKPALHKGKNQMFLLITEFVRAVQYDRKNFDDLWDVYGTVSCKAELEGTMPTVTMTISQATEGEITPINNIIIHPCVQSADTYIQKDGNERAMPRRVRFTPPLEMITLCHYTVNPTRTPPITGSFELFTEEDRAKIKVHLRLSENIKNNFEYCELQIPFGKRGPVAILESSVNHGTLLLSPDKSILVWNIGQRFPAKLTEIIMSCVVQMANSQAEATGSIEEQFCTGQKAFAQLYFKILDFTQSGNVIDAKSIQVAPAMKYKLTCVREFLSSEYKLWNVHGDCLVSSIPKYLCDQQPLLNS